MKKRICLWALIGFNITCLWVIFGMLTFPLFNYGRWMAFAITVPASFIAPTIPLTYYAVAIMNAATYALVGLAAEPLFRRHR
ncbi:MAG TPA: hypothetical protein VGG45_18340 [Terracidiphilus sp.]|jgi:hypothetical protein